MAKKRRRECRFCGRKEGDTVDRCGNEDGVPLGDLEKCPTCKRLACPDCLHEMNCCFDDAINHENDPTWAPRGWTAKANENGSTSYVRTCG